ncbi:MAG: ankyrin repeat domain-containing protein [Acidobacteria bacterium]|nr:ankyrin repeat domain-containing protein [Acidobacteriota bacterium]
MRIATAILLLAAAAWAETPKPPQAVNTADSRGYTPLILAAYHGDLENVKMLLAAGADVHARDKSGRTALMGAAFKGHVEIARLLLARGARVDDADGIGATPLMFAALTGRGEMVDLLLASGANAARRDQRGYDAAGLAEGQGNEPLFNRLVRAVRGK